MWLKVVFWHYNCNESVFCFNCADLSLHTENLAKWTVSYPSGFDNRYRLHKKAKFCLFMTFSQMTPFFMSHYGNVWQKRVNKCKKSGGYDSFLLENRRLVSNQIYIFYFFIIFSLFNNFHLSFLKFLIFLREPRINLLI